MSSTVTITTVTTVSTFTVLGSIGLIVALTLIFLLVKKEIFATSTHPAAQSISRMLNIAIVPLGVAFVVVAIHNVMSLFR